ncbi:oxidoreductase [Rossellomorea aquimaris]|uniref:oxidoreductase n=1 Tax=Rossellomorea aquimaris TaxID=189382 RepID=UPI001CD5841E|nr:oxidoreductase [Rossellomorea aquimaris]MCA1055490.1 oxidoreductase [Rossellomorea aquimaris]
MKPITIGLAGYGFSGQSFHRPLLQHSEKFTIHTVMSSNEEKVQQDLEGIKVVKTLDELLQEEIELVVITTPNHLHYTMIKKALEAGKHVVVEKPFVTNSAEGDELIRLAEEKGLLLSVFHNRRWDADFLTLEKLLNEKRLGELATYEAHFDRYRPAVKDRWKENKIDGGGVLYDLGAHLIDQALCLFGKPQWVFADVFAQRDPEKAEDYFQITFGYEGMRVGLYSRSMVLDPGPRYQVHGKTGSFMKVGMDPQESDLKEGIDPYSSEWGREDESLWGTLSLANEDGVTTGRLPSEKGDYTKYYEGIYEALRNNGTVPVRAEDANDVIRIIEACIQSSHDKRAIKIGEV